MAAEGFFGRSRLSDFCGQSRIAASLDWAYLCKSSELHHHHVYNKFSHVTASDKGKDGVHCFYHSWLINLQSFPKNLRRIFEGEAGILVSIHYISECLLWFNLYPESHELQLHKCVLTSNQVFWRAFWAPRAYCSMERDLQTLWRRRWAQWLR